MMIAMSTAVWPMKPWKKREISTISRITTAASTMWETWPALGFICVTTWPPWITGLPAASSTGILGVKSPLSPAIRPMSAPISDSPIIMITVPVTSGGKNRSTIENGLAISSPNTPEMISAP